MMIRICFFLLVLLTTRLMAAGQTVSYDDYPVQGIDIYEDPRLNEIMERDIALNKAKNGIDGYRIQIFFNSGPSARNEANRLKAKVLSDYPDVPVYILFHSPFYKVRVGNYRSKLDALNIYFKLKKRFPGAYIVKDVILFPALRDDKSTP